MKIIVVGAGIIGRLLAWQAHVAGHEVLVFDKAQPDTEDNASFAAAGMIAPAAEIQCSDARIYDMGQRSLTLWPMLLEKLKLASVFKQYGSLLIAHRQDQAELQHMFARLDVKLNKQHHAQWIQPQDIQQLEPALAHHQQAGIWLPEEAHLNSQLIMRQLKHRLLAHNVVWHHTTVETITPYAITTQTQRFEADWVCDCRGLGAQNVYPDLRAVRGEVIHLHAPEVQIKRPLRLYHPRYHLYLVPHDEHRFVLGASEIDSQDFSPISVRSCLELLSALYSLLPAFAEARIIKTMTHCRAAFANHEPRIDQQPGLVRINGLYRHGFMLAPALIQDCLMQINAQQEKQAC